MLRCASPSGDLRELLLDALFTSNTMLTGGLKHLSGGKWLDQEVCYGTLYDAAAKTLGSTRMSNLPDIRDAAPFTNFCVQAKDHIHVLCSENGDEFAVLDTRTASRLSALSETPMLRFEAVVRSSVFLKRQRISKQVSQSFQLSINIFGSMSTADDVAYQLSKVSAYLQHPESLHSEVEYHNPQFLTFANEEFNMRDFVGTVNNSPCVLDTTSISEEVGRILESLAYTDVATEKLEFPTGLTAELKIHQNDGVRFILQREEEAFSQRLAARLCQAVGIQIESPVSMSFGGLIADVMGLGKTLTMLAAVLRSMPAAEDSSKFYEASGNEYSNKFRTKATLVVVSSAQLLESWISEIRTHFSLGALTFVCFHGQNRPRDAEALKSVGLVLTTYATLAADSAGQRTLYQMEWYRIVLDEAHWIRNSSSKQFRAATCLDTRRRWCLTGTPIQNKLEDLTSLAQFLQLPHLSTRVTFQKYIIGPLSEGGPNFAKPLRGYLEAYCLRRSEKCLTLPPFRQEHVTLQFSSEERRLYDLILDDTRKQVDALISKGNTSSCSKLFTAMLRLRMLCNLGTFSSTSASTGAKIGRQKLDTGCERCSATDEDTLILLDGCSFCPDCGRPLFQSSPLPDSADSQGSDADSSGRDAGMTLDRAANILTMQKKSFQRNGFSTKLNAVVQSVVRSGPDSKNIVFSYWTSTLDLLSQLLRQTGIIYRQVDGRTSYVERSKGLKAFKEDPGVSVLLMTIGTGAVGLNLTVANKVHLVEPQWNPAVEEQAIARALRMGQTRQVTITRYVMKTTIEQNIINLQKKKNRLAKCTFDTGTQTLSGTLEDLRSLFDMSSE
ncbi:SNF2 family N-terminal domain-containing protein [Ustulina deusta]|nr:SNF2 family N-terminal domain-containing protein [Ustulina deusta]